MHSTYRSILSGVAGLFLLTAATLTQANTITVDSAVDIAAIDGKCALREAIISANTDSNAPYGDCTPGSGADVIEFSGAMTIVLTATLPFVTESLTINGIAAASTIIDGGNAHRPFKFDSPGDNQTFTLSNMTLRNGRSGSANPEYNGGAIRVLPGETLTLSHMVIKDNVATDGGGGIYLQDATAAHPTTLTVEFSTLSGNEAQGRSSGGGIRAGAASNITINDSTLSGNSATNVVGSGGGITSSTTGGINSLTIRRSTFANNAANAYGGGILLSSISTSSVATNIVTSISNSTLIGNTADSNNDHEGKGGGIAIIASDLTLTNTIIAGNTLPLGKPHDIARLVTANPSTFTTNGYNFIGTNATVTTAFPAGSPNANHDFVGSSAAPLDPDLAALADNGGPTQTRAPSSSASAVVDKGKCTGETADQRGYSAPGGATRVVDDASIPNAAGGDGCDIGAVEFAASPPGTPAPDDGMCFPVSASNGKLAVICL